MAVRYINATSRCNFYLRAGQNCDIIQDMSAESNEKQNYLPGEIVAQLNLRQKCAFLVGANFWRLESNDEFGLKRIMMSDGPHGLRKQEDAGDHLGINESAVSVCFPTAAGMAASFDRHTLQTLGNYLGEECVAEGVGVLLGPGINIKRSPLCGRNFEYFSEDPYLSGELAAAYTNGVQQKGVGVSVKHFVANNQETRRASNSSVIDERTLREIYFPAFENVVKRAAPRTLMSSYNKLNGKYVAEDKRVMDDILRGEWGFKGLVVSDWAANSNRVANLKAGMDLEMPGGQNINTKKLLKAVKDGELDERYIDRACERVIALIQDCQKNLDKTYEYSREAHHQVARRMAARTMVLLKNQNKLLPLKGMGQKILFVGEFAKDSRFQGNGSSVINPYKVLNALDESAAYANVNYQRGFSSKEDKVEQNYFDTAVEAAKDADVVVVFAGLPHSWEAEAYDREHINLPEVQNKLITEIAKVNKNVAVVLQNGAPVAMPWANEAGAILEAYLGGETAGGAIADILFGKVNPSAKLAETFPLKTEDSPCHKYFPGSLLSTEYREGLFVGYRYYDTANVPVLFPFGHGLSYTKFDYSGFKIEHTGGFDYKLTFNVKNTGDMSGSEIAQIYVGHKNSKIFRAKRELKGFEKIRLDPGESKRFTILLDERSFAYYNVKMGKFVVEPGEYAVQVGASIADIRLEKTVEIACSHNGEEYLYNRRDYESYYSLKVQDVGDDEFTRLYGGALPPKTLPSGHIFDYTATVEQAKDTKWGGLVYRRLKKIAEKSPFPKVVYCFLMQTPMTNLMQATMGQFSEWQANAIVNLFNGKKVLRSLLNIIWWGLTKGSKLAKIGDSM